MISNGLFVQSIELDLLTDFVAIYALKPFWNFLHTWKKIKIMMNVYSNHKYYFIVKFIGRLLDIR